MASTSRWLLRASYCAALVLLLMAFDAVAQPGPGPVKITCQNSAVAAALSVLSQKIAQNQADIANCTPPSAVQACNASQLTTLNSTATALNNEFQAELAQCEPVPPPPPQQSVGILGMEVTQAVQDMKQSVPLIAGKQTWARVYLSTATPMTVTGTLQIKNSAGAITNVQASGTAALTANATLQQVRASWTASLNFPIPASSTATNSAYTLTLADVTATGGNGVNCGNCGSTTVSVQYVNAPPLRLRIVPIQYTDSKKAIITPRQIDYTLLQSWVKRAYPISQLIPTVAAPLPISTSTLFPPTCGTTPTPGCCPVSAAGTCGCVAVNTALATLRATELAGTPPIDSRTHYYGMVFNDANAPGGGYLRGCSPISGKVGSGPAGNPSTAGVIPGNENLVPGDSIGYTPVTFGDWYGGHELGHSLGRKHPNVPAATNKNCPQVAPPALDTSYPYPLGQISDNQGDTVGLDVGDKPNGIPLNVYAGITYLDIMTYCYQPQWMSDYTYEAILSGGLVAQDPSGSGPAPERTAGRFVSVVANIDLTKKTGKIEFAQTVGQSVPVAVSAEDKASLRFTDSSGKTIAQYSVNIAINSDAEPGGDITGLVDAVVPIATAAAKLQLYYGDTLLDTRNIGKTGPTVRNIKLAATNMLTWQSTAAAGVALTYTVQGTADGQQWDTIALSLAKPQLQLSADQVKQYRTFRVVANDGFNNSDAVALSPANR